MRLAHGHLEKRQRQDENVIVYFSTVNPPYAQNYVEYESVTGEDQSRPDGGPHTMIRTC